MKITVSQLRKIIQEEIQVTGEAKSIGALHGVRSPNSLKLKLGDIYRNPNGHQISIKFLDADLLDEDLVEAEWELLARGASKFKFVVGTVKELKSALLDGGFEFIRNETAY